MNALFLISWFWPDGESIQETNEPVLEDSAVLWELVREYNLEPYEPGVWYRKTVLDDGQYREAELQVSEAMHDFLERWLEHTREGLDAEFPWPQDLVPTAPTRDSDSTTA